MIHVHRHKPYPELVERARPAGAWRVLEVGRVAIVSRGAVNKVERWMAVPLKPDGRPVCLHELAHVRWSPRRLPEVRFDARVLAVVEDARINLALAAAGLGVALDREGRAHVAMLAAQDAKRGDVFALLARCVASLGTNVEAELAGWLGEQGGAGVFVGTQAAWVRRALEEARRRSGGEIAPFRDAWRVARRLAHALRAAGLLDAQGRARTDLVEAEACCLGDADLDGDFPDLPLPGDSDATSRRARTDGAAGLLEVRRVPLAVQLRPGRGDGRGWRPSREGGVVRYLQRWIPDRAIFRRRRRTGGGRSVLIDTSGSMRLDERDLDALLRATPAGGRVAMYSGSGGVGELRIVASGTRRAAAAHLHPYAAGNIVDVPALQWLARQPAPRLWISDGRVTGVGDRRDRAIDERVRAICRAGRIERVPDVGQAIGLLTGRGGRPATEAAEAGR